MTQANKPSLTPKKKKGRLKEYRWPIAGVLFFAPFASCFVIRLPYYIEMPGTAEDILIGYDSGWKNGYQVRDLMTL